VCDVNPFHPSFGVSPPVLVGRDRVLEDVALGLDEGPGALERASLVIGPRGIGKTVLLNEVRALAHERGWVVVAETATPGLLERLTTEAFPRALREVDPASTGWRLTSGSAAGFGASWESTSRYAYDPGLRSMWHDLCSIVDKAGRGGVMVTLDEVHGDAAGLVRGDLRQIGATFQHLRSENLSVAFAAAGLPSAVKDVLNDGVLTFLRRGARFELDLIDRDDVRYALQTPLVDGGRSIDEAALNHAVDASDGYPFMIQLIGSQMWRLTNDGRPVDLSVAEHAVRRAFPLMAQLVFQPVLTDLSARDVDFLVAMTPDDGRTKIADVQLRLGVDRNYANQYRARLIAAEIIRPAGHGVIEFAMPYLRDYLRSETARRRTVAGSPAAQAILDGWKELSNDLQADPSGPEVGLR
jgi:AAA ATPase domain